MSRWKVRIPEAGIKVHLQPLIAATEAASDGAIRPEPRKSQPASKPKPRSRPSPDQPAPANETVILAFVGAAPNVRIDWTPKAEGATGLEALASVQAEEQVTVGEGVTRTRVQLAYSISRAELRQLAIEVPAGQKVVNVFDPNVRQWSVEQPGAAEKAPGGEPAVGKWRQEKIPTQKILVQLFEPAKSAQNITIELEKFAEDKAATAPSGHAGDEGLEKDPRASKGPAKGSAPIASAALSIPVVKALGVGRQQGVVVVQVAEGLRAEAARSTGLLQMDAAELPPAAGAASGRFRIAMPQFLSIWH